MVVVVVFRMNVNEIREDKKNILWSQYLSSNTKEIKQKKKEKRKIKDKSQIKFFFWKLFLFPNWKENTKKKTHQNQVEI